MMKNTRIALGILIAAAVAGCGETVSTLPEPGLDGARLDVQSASSSGFGMGSGSRSEDDAEATTSTVQSDSTARSGFGMGSGS